MPPPRVGSPTVNLTAVAQRMQRAQDELLRTDNPANDHPAVRKSEPSIDAAEATTTSDLAQKAWAAGNKVWGTQAQVGGPSAWTQTLFERSPVPKTDLQNLQNVALRVLHSLVPYGATELPRAQLDQLPQHVDTYWAQTFGATKKLMPEQRDAMVAFIRAAVDD